MKRNPCIRLFETCLRTRFLKSENGNATAEVVLWTPFFALLLGILADTSLIFGGEAEVLRIVQDANRSLSVGRFLTVTEAQEFLAAEIAEISPNATITVAVTDGIIETSVLMPASDLTATGMFDAFADVNVLVQATHMSET